MMRLAILLGVVILGTAAAVMAQEPMTAVIRVSCGPLYDYVIVGENPKATDGYDNAYDTISPGNLNASMGEPFISSVVIHPDWKPALRELRGDIRAPSRKQVWKVALTSSLPAGETLTVQLDRDRTTIPVRVRLVVKDGKKESDLKAGDYLLPAPGPGKTSELVIVAEQP